jgi:hypothetical protein
LFAGFIIVASCARAAPGSPEKKQAFSKNNCQIKIFKILINTKY